MQIEIYTPTQGQPLPPVEWNYEAVKQWVSDGLAAYEGRVYTEDTVAEAKRDRANLNKLSKAIEDKRKELKSVYLTPYNSFEAQAKELVAMIKKQSDAIDAQVKAYDQKRRDEKLDKIKTELYAPMIGDLAELVPYQRLHDPKWLNVTVGMAAISEALSAKIESIASGLATLDKLELPEDVAGQVKAEFLKSYDLGAAMAAKDRIMDERERMARYLAAQNFARAEQEAQKEMTPATEQKPAQAQKSAPEQEERVNNEQVPFFNKEPETITLDFRVWVTAEQMYALRDFLVSNRIRYGKVPRESEV